MSGGSYEYLYCKEVDALLVNDEPLRQMADRLLGLNYAKDVARETEEILTAICQFRKQMQGKLARLSDIWRAVEWWDSGDGGEDELKVALGKYRKSRMEEV